VIQKKSFKFGMSCLNSYRYYAGLQCGILYNRAAQFILSCIWRKTHFFIPKLPADIYKSTGSDISRGLKSYGAERHSVLVPYAKIPVTTCCRKSYILAVNICCLLFSLTGPRYIQGNTTSSTGFGDKIRELTLGESGSGAFI
jgi:hypothetical protein